MYANLLKRGSTIGVFSPSHVLDAKQFARIESVLKRLGFQVKLGANAYKNTWGYVASAKERAADLNALVADDAVDAVFFTGGESAVDILPYIDYANIKKHPKIFCSYSDGTSIVNAIYAQTGLVTYYGPTPHDFLDLRQYNYQQFTDHFVVGRPKEFTIDLGWQTLKAGKAEGILIGGYNSLFAMMLTSPYFSYDPKQKYILFIEDHEAFSNVGELATYMTFIGQSVFMKSVRALIFGHYNDNPPQDLLNYLKRFGAEHKIPVVYSDDFGHGTNHAVLPIGVKAKLNTATRRLQFEY